MILTLKQDDLAFVAEKQMPVPAATVFPSTIFIACTTQKLGYTNDLKPSQ